jgi:hypothetical protein
MTGRVIPGWDIGGQIYSDYISLVQPGHRRGTKRDAVVRLLRALPGMEVVSFEQRVAQTEMSRVVANMVVSTAELVRPRGDVGC